MFSIDLSIRYRFEQWKGMNARNYGDDTEEAIGHLDDSILFQRIIAGFTWQPSEKLVIGAHLQDSRAYGWSLRDRMYPSLFQVRQSGTHEPYYTMNPNEAFFEIHDAYVEYLRLFDRFSITLGRQKINYGDNRIFGPGEWGNTGRWTWDALKVSYTIDSHIIDIFAGGTKIHDPNRLSIPFTETEFWGGGIYAHIETPFLFTMEPFYAHKSQGSADFVRDSQINRHWLGMRIINRSLGNFVVDATLARQFGDEHGRSIAAFGIFAKAGYRFNSIWGRPLIGLRETYATGNKKDSGVIRQFDPAFGANDRYYGRMNIIRWSNIDNREIMLELNPMPGLKIEWNFNMFYIPEPEGVQYLGTLQLQEGEHHLGNEMNVFIQYQVSKRWQLIGVLGYFIPGSVQNINGKPPKPASWYATQVLFNL
jgi:hypothetical protein